jgi:hypothetical protein
MAKEGPNTKSSRPLALYKQLKRPNMSNVRSLAINSVRPHQANDIRPHQANDIRPRQANDSDVHPC